MSKTLIQKLQASLLLPLVCFIITCTIAFMYIYEPLFLKYLDRKLYDVFLGKVHSKQTTGVPCIVDIDEASLNEFGQWPWPRYRVAQLLVKIQNAGAKAIAPDILFAEADRTSLGVLKQSLKRDLKVDVQFTGLPDALLDNDRILANIIAKGPFVLGSYFYFYKSAQQSAAPFLHPLKLAIVKTPGAADSQDFLINAQSVLPTIQVLSEKARISGFINTAADEDGILRSTPLLLTWRGMIYPSLALAALWVAFDEPAGALKISKGGVESLRLGKLSIPLDQNGRLLLHFRGPRFTFPYISASDVLNDKLEPLSLAGKIVFVGTSATGLHDLRPTPLDPMFPGVEAHATIVDNILAGDYFIKPDWVPGLEIILIIFTAFITGVLITRLKAVWVLPVALFTSTLIWYGSVWTLGRWRIFISPLFPILSLVINFSLLTLIKFWISEKKKRFFKDAFSMYVSKSVVEQIANSPESLSLNGEEKNISIMFSDVRGFSTLSEKLTPTQVSDLLQDFLTPMTGIITRHDGTVDKFIGDAIMAFWNAPVDVPAHESQALRSGLAMHAALKELNLEFKEKYGFEVDIGVGIHSGMVRVGNMGSKDLFDYTILGDNVNLTSRLEGLTRFYGVPMVVSDTMISHCPADYLVQELDMVTVKGKKKPVTIYSLTSANNDTFQKQLGLYIRALKLYRTRQFGKALALFMELRHGNMENTLYALYCDRCDSFIQVPPPDDWNGVFIHTSK
jgi:adenylate cyclase